MLGSGSSGASDAGLNARLTFSHGSSGAETVFGATSLGRWINRSHAKAAWQRAHAYMEGTWSEAAKGVGPRDTEAKALGATSRKEAGHGLHLPFVVQRRALADLIHRHVGRNPQGRVRMRQIVWRAAQV